VDFLPSLKLELVMMEEQVDDAIDAIVRNAGTGELGDRKIFLSKIDDIIRIRNQQRGVAAL
jgi:nitrogen regulatory protein P-II 1